MLVPLKRLIRHLDAADPANVSLRLALRLESRMKQNRLSEAIPRTRQAVFQGPTCSNERCRKTTPSPACPIDDDAPVDVLVVATLEPEDDESFDPAEATVVRISPKPSAPISVTGKCRNTNRGGDR